MARPDATDDTDGEGEGSQSGTSDMSFELPDALATGREKRQTAGNRLRDMLNAELESEALFAEDEEDEDFGSDQDQQEDLESEFDSSSGDEPVAPEADDVGEQALKTKENEIARARKRKAQGALANPRVVKRAQASQTGPPKKIKPTNEGYHQPKRQSSRAHAVEIAADVEKRLADEAAKKARMVKHTKVEEHILTQEEKLAAARITEEMNVASLNRLVSHEEKKKADQKMLAARRRAFGPVIRYVSTSKTINARIPEESDDPTAQSLSEMDVPDITALPLNTDNSGPTETKSLEDDAIVKSPSGIQEAPKAQIQRITNLISFENLAGTEVSEPPNFQELLLGELCRTKPAYPDTPFCTLSGLSAKYRDPETQICYGNAQAYAALQQLKTGSVPWSSQLKMYVPKDS